MGQDTNIVLEGHRKGQLVRFSADEGLVWIGNKVPEHYSNFFYKDVVTSVKKLDEKESSLRDSVHIWLGSVAAAGMSSVQDYIVSVEWKTGEESLIKVRDVVYEVILCNMVKNQPVIDYEPRYLQAIKDYGCNDYTRIKNAMRVFNSISFYKEAEAYAEKCQAKLNSPELSSQKEKVEKEAADYDRRIRKGLFIATICAEIFFLLFVIVPGDSIALGIIGLVCCIPLSIIFGKQVFEPKAHNQSKFTKNEIERFHDNNFVYITRTPTTLSVQSNSAFTNMKLVIPNTFNNKTVTTISNYAFSNCGNLNTIVIPQSVTSIEAFAFENCSSLNRIIYNGTMSDWQSITKAASWDASTSRYTIYCTDGTISK